MAFQRERHVRRGHAAPVVRHFDEFCTPCGEPNGNTRCTRVDRVFDQFLEGAGRAFDDFASSDSIDQMFGQAPY
jgi:hypothetical protein